MAPASALGHGQGHGKVLGLRLPAACLPAGPLHLEWQSAVERHNWHF